MKILAVDDETVALESIRRLLRRRGFADVETCDGGKEAIERILAEDFDVVLLDILMPEVDGLKVLERTKPYKPGTEFIVVSAVEDVPTSVRAVRLGAYDYLVKPVSPDRLQLSLQRAYERKGLRAGLAGSTAGKTRLQIPEAFSGIVTRNPRMIELIRYADTMARSGMPILITGESGTGKELFARGIHEAGRGKDRPFVPVNVTAVPESLFESQFFGHVRGAFTDATADHVGYFLQANGGTLFMDEIGELPGRLQVKFLRVLEEESVARLGEKQASTVDVQIVSSTNADLEAACREGRFRLDLYYRLNAGTLQLPPLRERPDDIPLLAEHFLGRAARRLDKPALAFSRPAMEVLTGKSYPGNVRELIAVVNNAVLRCDSDRILPTHLGKEIEGAPSFSRRLCSLKENTEAHIAYVYTRSGGDTVKMAEILQISVRQVQRRLAEMRSDPQWATLFENN